MHRNNRHFEGPIDPEQLKFLAAISTEWRAELQRRQAEDAEAERQRGLKAFVESITAPVTPGLDRSLTREEVQTFVNAITGAAHRRFEKGIGMLQSIHAVADHRTPGGGPRRAEGVETQGMAVRRLPTRMRGTRRPV